ncbi:Aminomethyltransferase (glycine cleavage system T protein) [hydrothermal vent metagenome]|uniref:aminomethyltransferase n=1 Tax=hydrothermal vent metagenome TaxID=652676 RepID=A0A3B1DLS3_9ZZZZ
MKSDLQKTPLYKQHIALGARMVGFGGWDMPVQYEGILAEYEQTRKRAALFDISHMGEFIIEGDCVSTGFDRLVTMNIKDMPIKSCRYGAMLNEDAGTLDDLIVFRMEQEKWFVVVNAATTPKDVEHIQKNLSSGASFKDVSAEMGKIDVQGPLARDVLSALVKDIERLEYYTFDFFDLLGKNVLISRTGYTGELGYEIYYPWNKTVELWDTFLKDKRVKPVGLGARDVLRLEMGYSLYGHELSEDISPLEAGLNRFVDWDKDFLGKEALLAQKVEGVRRKVVGLASLTRRTPREGHKIYSEQGKGIGVVTSGTFSPVCNQGIGLGFVVTDEVKMGKKIFFGDDKNKISATISSRFVYKGSSLKN